MVKHPALTRKNSDRYRVDPLVTYSTPVLTYEHINEQVKDHYIKNLNVIKVAKRSKQVFPNGSELKRRVS